MTILINPRVMFLFFALISAASLGMALIAEHMFGLQPCILCIYQRWPYAIVIALGIIGFFVAHKKGQAGLFGLIGLTMIANSAIAFYHTGVELKWWPSHLEGCNSGLSGSAEDILAQIEARTEAARCDEIPWADPILGLSMANYNVVFCLGLGILAFWCAYKNCKK